MRKLTLLFFTCLSTTLLVAQNTFPSSGNVGIGTASPSSKLEIIGNNTGDDVLAIKNNDFSRLAIYSATNDADPLPFVMGFRSRGTVSSPSNVQSNDRLFGVYANPYVNGSYRKSAAIQMKAGSLVGPSSYSSYMTFETTLETSREERMRITEAGDVGIGTTSPSSKLEVVGNNTLDDVVAIKNDNYSRLAIYSAANSAGPLPFVVGFRSRGTVSNPSNVQTNDRLFGVYANTYVNGAYRANAAIEMKAGAQISGSSYSSYMIFGTTSGTSREERMRITEAGNVGIGTSNPGTYKLAVNGSVRAKEVVVETGWADFVFEKDYALRTLEEVESFIEENGHLPEVPSADVVKEEGLKVGEAQTLLLQKIEELTLYTINQQKQIESLKAEMASLAGKQ